MSLQFFPSAHHKHFFTHQISLHNSPVIYNFQFSFISLQDISIFSVKLDIFVQVVLSNTSQEFLVTVIAPIKLAKYIQLNNIDKIKIIFFMIIYEFYYLI
jgi:hypothetical protein